MNVSVILATMNRAEDVGKALASLAGQSAPPIEVLVIDQSTDGRTRAVAAGCLELFRGKGIDLKHVIQEEKSLVRARNRGLDLARGEIVSFIDDDVVLFPDYYERIVQAFRRDPRVGGVSGNVLVGKPPSGAKWAARKALMRAFLLSRFDGRMTASGFGYPIYEREIERAVAVEMLPGCDMSYRRDAIGEERFDEWFTGYGFREDCDFSYRISRKARLLMVPDAKLHHHHSPRGRLSPALLKRMEFANYHYLFLKYKRRRFYSGLSFAYSCAGLVLIDLIEFLCNLDLEKYSKLRAALASSRHLLSRRPGPAGGSTP